MLKKTPCWLLVGGLLLSFLLFIPTVRAAESELEDEVIVVPVDGELVKILGTSFESDGKSPEDPCVWPRTCYVPSPTLIAPSSAERYSDGRTLVITGLSWNETKVDVYIDGRYNGRADLRTDPNNIGNFVYRPFLPLMPGTHTIYTVARNLSELERSPQSPTITFSVASLSQEGTAGESSRQQSAQDTAKSSNNDDELSANDVLDSFFNQSSTATTTASTTPGLSTLATIMLILIGAGIITVLYQLMRARRDDGSGMIPPDQYAPPDESHSPPGA